MPGVLIYCTNKRRRVYSVMYGISCWFGVRFTIICIRTQKFLLYASSAIFRTCYSLSVRKNCLTYEQPSRYIYGASVAYYCLLPEVSPVYRILNHAVDDDDWWRSSTSSRQYAQKELPLELITIDNSRQYKNNLLTNEKILRLSVTFKFSFRTIFCGTNRTVSCLHLRWLTCGVEYCDCGQCGCETSRNGRGLLPIGDNSHGPRPSYLQL